MRASQDVDLSVHEAQRRIQGRLCSRCTSLDFNRMFQGRNQCASGFPCYVMTLGDIAAQAKSSCAVCRLLDAMKMPLEGRLGCDYAIYYHLLPSTDDRVLSVLSLPQDGETYSMTHAETLEMHPDHSGFIATASHLRPKLCPSVSIRPVQASIGHFATFRKWIDTCVHKHGELCANGDFPAKQPDILTLINCDARTIVRPPSNANYKYTALSYVWGGRADDKYKSRRGRLPAKLPATMEDAIKITQKLGVRWIWIDRYCVDQENEAVKHAQFQQMNLVYKKAFVTIIAAAGEDPHFGLPGVGLTPRLPQPDAWIGERHLVSTLTNPRKLISTSKWNKRAWTYQEGFFSQRRLIFTEEQAYFVCGTARYRESYSLKKDEPELFHLGPRQMLSPWRISEYLHDYCGQELSHSEDAVRAFEGVFNELKAHSFPLYHCNGVPIRPAMYCQRPMERNTNSERFLAGLCWRNDAPGARRDTFPSWTWAGWKVPISRDCPELTPGFGGRGTNPLKLFVEALDGSLLDFDDDRIFVQVTDSRESIIKVLRIEAWTIPITLSSFQDHAPDESSWSKILVNDRSIGPENPVAVFETGSTRLRMKVSLLRPFHDLTYALQEASHPGGDQHMLSSPTEDAEKPNLLGIILGACEDWPPSQRKSLIFVLVVQEKGDIFERVGHMEFSQFTDVQSYSYDPHRSRDTKMRSAWKALFAFKKKRLIRLG